MLGIDAQALAEAAAKAAGEEPEGDELVVWPELHAPWRLFLGMATQWKTASGGMGPSFRTGLDYLALEPVARSRGIEYPLSPQVFADLQLMEAEALSVWSKRRRG